MIGWCEADITPSNPKVELAGQYYQRVATGIHSRIKCVALAMKKGDQQSVEVTLDVVGMPASLQKEGRTFYLLSCHGGEVSVLAEGTGTTLECEVDKFSTFMIAYKDDSASGNSGTSGNSGASSSGSASAQAATPKTGDSIPAAVPTALAFSTAALLLLAARKRRDR